MFTVRFKNPHLTKWEDLTDVDWDYTLTIPNRLDKAGQPTIHQGKLDAFGTKDTVVECEGGPQGASQSFMFSVGYSYSRQNVGEPRAKVWQSFSVNIEAKPGSEVVIEYTFVERKPTLISLFVTYITLDKTLKSVEVRESASIVAASDSPQVKKEEYTVKHTIGVQDGAKLETEVKGKLWVIEASIKGQIERITNRTYEESKTTTREVIVPANGKKYKLVWLETYRTGKAITVINGKKHEIPFEFRDGWDLQTREVRE